MEEFFAELRRQYLTEAPARLAELEKDLAALRTGERDAAASLRGRFHRLAGSGGSYGFQAISDLSRDAELWLTENPEPGHAALAYLDSVLGRLAGAFDQGALELGPPVAGAGPQRIGFGWRAVVVGGPSKTADRVRRALEDATYTVAVEHLGSTPEDLPVSRHPDLAVLVAGSGLGEAAAAAARWSRAGTQRPFSVVLVVEGGAVNPLEPAFAELDLILPADRVEEVLRAHGKTLGAPVTVLMVDPDEADLSSTAGRLEAGGARVVRCLTASEAVAVLEREVPDAAVLEWVLPDATGAALIRMIRRSESHRLTAVVVLTAGATLEDRLEALRVGADDVLVKPVAQRLLMQTVLTRAARGRWLRTMVRRDDLTGLLNQTTLLDELEQAVGFAQRAGEAFALFLLDLDHFGRLNVLHGYQAGDAVLGHVGRCLGQVVRSSDFVARMGGEEFGVLARRCSPDHAAALAERLRQAIASDPITYEESVLSVRASAGAACYPRHASSGAELLAAAEKALQEAKRSGRDRVVVAEG